MKEYYLAKIKCVRETDQGLLKQVTEQYLVDSVSFTETEAIIYDKLSESVRGDFKVTHISISNVTDVFHYDDQDVWFKAKVQYFAVDPEAGKEKKVVLYMLVTAKDVPQAHERIRESLSNMLVSFEIPDIVETKILEVF